MVDNLSVGDRDAGRVEPVHRLKLLTQAVAPKMHHLFNPPHDIRRNGSALITVGRIETTGKGILQLFRHLDEEANEDHQLLQRIACELLGLAAASWSNEVQIS